MRMIGRSVITNSGGPPEDSSMDISRAESRKTTTTRGKLSVRHTEFGTRHSMLACAQSSDGENFRRLLSVKDKVQHVLDSYEIQFLLTALIALSSVLVVVQTNEKANGEDVKLWQRIVGTVLLACFTLEVAGRIYVDRCQFFYSLFNVADFTITGSDLILEVFSWSDNSNKLSFVPTLRFMRLVRLTRVLRMLTGFRELFMMVHGLQSAMKAMFWSFLMIGVAIVIWSIIGVEFIRPLVWEAHDKGLFAPELSRSRSAYDSVWKGCLTLLSTVVAGDSWGQYSIPVMEAHPVSALFFCGSYMSINLGVMNLIVAVMVDRAAEARYEDDEYALQEKGKSFKQAASKLQKICEELDTDDDGFISWEEFEAGAYSSSELVHFLKLMDITFEDLSTVYQYMDVDNSGSVSYREFIQQIHRLKTVDHRTMLVLLWQQNVHVFEKLEQKLKKTISTLADEGRLSGRLPTSEGRISCTRVGEPCRDSGRVSQSFQVGSPDRLSYFSVFGDNPVASRNCDLQSKLTLSSSSDRHSTKVTFVGLNDVAESQNLNDDRKVEHLYSACQDSQNKVKMGLEQLQTTIDSHVCAMINNLHSNFEPKHHHDIAGFPREERLVDTFSDSCGGTFDTFHGKLPEKLRDNDAKDKHVAQIPPTLHNAVEAFELSQQNASLGQSSALKVEPSACNDRARLCCG